MYGLGTLRMRPLSKTMTTRDGNPRIDAIQAHVRMTFAGRADGGELADTLRDLIANCYAYAHYAGVRRGYLIASQLFRFSSEKTENRAKAAIARLIERYPEWTTSQIFEALDEKENLRFYRLQNVPKHVTRWSDVAKEPTYKMFVSRIREKVRAKRRITGWKKLMQNHKALRRMSPTPRRSLG
jgi:hypothetical protein